ISIAQDRQTLTVTTDAVPLKDMRILTQTLTAGSHSFDPATHNRYDGQTEILSPATVSDDDFTLIQGNLIAKSALTHDGGGDLIVHGNMVALAPLTLQADGMLEVSGDLILRDTLTITGAGGL